MKLSRPDFTLVEWIVLTAIVVVGLLSLASIIATAIVGAHFVQKFW